MSVAVGPACHLPPTGPSSDPNPPPKESNQLVPPTLLLSLELEYSVHRVPVRMAKELKRVFVGVDLANCLIVPTFQRTKIDLTSIGQAIENVKDECLETFYQWGQKVCESLISKGYWADMADPTSGYPMLGEQGPSFYPEVIGAQMLLGYDLLNTGCCKVLSHPKWGTKVYPASLFTTAPLEVLLAAIPSSL